MKRFVYEEDGEVRVVIPAPGVPSYTVIQRSIPKGKSFLSLDEKDLPDEWEFFKAWKRDKDKVKVDTEKARGIAHEYRRKIREEKMKPYDDIVAKRIPGQEKKAEEERQNLRDHFAIVQDELDAATTPAEMKQILKREAQNGLHL